MNENNKLDLLRNLNLKISLDSKVMMNTKALLLTLFFTFSLYRWIFKILRVSRVWMRGVSLVGHSTILVLTQKIM